MNHNVVNFATALLRKKTDATAMQDVTNVQKKRGLTFIASGKGGVGKTWLSIHLSHALGLIGENILLVDGDFGLANVDVQLGLMPKIDLSSVLRGEHTLETCLLKEGFGAFHLLPGQSGSHDMVRLSPSRIALFKSLLMQQTQKYERVILDLGAGIGEMVMRFIPMASDVIVVVSGESTSLTDAYALIKVIHKKYPHIQVRTVINQVKTAHEGEVVFQKLARACEKFLGLRLSHLGSVMWEKHVRDAIQRQCLLPELYEDSLAWQNIQKIAATFTHQESRSYVQSTIHKKARLDDYTHF